jgi:hypothetical protein
MYHPRSPDLPEQPVAGDPGIAELGMTCPDMICPDMADPFLDIRADLEHIARSTDQSPGQMALGLARLIECGLVEVGNDDDDRAARRLRDLAATYA